MGRYLSRMAAVIVLGVAGVVSIERIAMAAPAQTPQQIYDACIAEMLAIRNESSNAIGDADDAFQARVEDSDLSIPVVDVFKDGSAVSARIQKIGEQGVARIHKAAVKCAAKLQRMHADLGLLDDLGEAHDEYIMDVRAWLASRQFNMADVIREYIANLT